MSQVSVFFRERLKEQREAAQLTQDQLGVAIGTSKVQISRYEVGYVLPNAENLVKLADALDCSIDYLLGRSDSPAGHGTSGETLSPVERAMLDALRKADISRALGLVGMALEDATIATRTRWARPMGRMVNTDLLGLRVTESPVVVMRGREPEKGGP